MYHLHGIAIDFTTDDPRIAARLERQWLPFRAHAEHDPADGLNVHLRAADNAPPPPDLPLVSQGPTVNYYFGGDQFVVHFARWGRYDIDLAAGTVDGAMTEASLRSYGVFEDMIIVALAPLLRRRGLYTIHAFAAAIADRAIVLIGDIGAGKTTTGIGLLCHGAQLISNDSPLLRLDGAGGISVCAYPGLLSAYPRSLTWFPQLSGVLAAATRLDGSEKVSFAADDVWANAWRQSAAPGALVFPKVEPGIGASQIRPLPKFQALQRLVSQSIENWDSATMPHHLHALRQLVDAAPTFELLLAPDIERIPDLITRAIS